MLLATLRRRFTLAIISMLFLTMFLPLNILPGTAFAQTKPGQCPQGKLCRLSTASLPTPAQGTYINVVPTSGPPNTSVAATGGGFPANDTIQIWFDQTDTGARATTDSQGNFKTNFNVPSNATLGIHPV